MRAIGFAVLTLILPAMATGAEAEVTTDDGLGLHLAANGAVAALRLDERRLSLSGEVGGFLVADVLAAGQDGAGPELLPDPGFDDTDAEEALWTFAGEWSLDEEAGHTEPPALRLHIPGTEDVRSEHLRSGPVPVAGGADYLLSYWIRLENVGGTSRPSVRIEQWDDEGNKTTDFFQITVPCPYTGDHDWVRIHHSFITDPDTTRVTLYANFYGGHGTFWLDDISLRRSRGVEPVPLRGEVSVADRDATLRCHSEELRLDLEAVFRGLPGAIRCDFTLRDLSGEDRGLRVYFRLPLDLTGWTWHDDALTRHAITDGPVYRDVYHREPTIEVSRYPWASVTRDADGLSLAVPMDVPRMSHRRATAECYDAVFDLGLSSATTKFPSAATAGFVIYRHDGAWGYRASTAKYYQVFPQLFTSRMERHGIWFFGLKPELVPDPESFGLCFDEHGGNHMGYDNEHGIYAFEYTEPWMYKEMLGDILKEELPTYDEAIARLTDDLDADPEVKQPAYYSGISRRDAVRSWYQCAFHDVDGRPMVGGNQYYGYYNQMYIVNPDIEITGEWGQLNRGMISWRNEIMRWIERAEREGTRFDGVYLDSVSLSWQRHENYRRELYAFADQPLAYNPTVGKVTQWKALCDYELAEFYHREMLDRGMYMMANIFPPAHTLYAHLLDMLGAGETDGLKPYEPGHYCYLRALAHHKPLSFMDYAYMNPEVSLEQLEAKLQDCLLYAVFPGTARFDNQEKIDRIRPLFRRYIPTMRALSEAGWEPVTYATAEPQATFIERYGPGLPGALHLAFRCTADEPTEVRVHVQSEVLGDLPPEALRVTDLMTGEVLPHRAEGKGIVFAKTPPAGKTVAVAISAPDRD